MKTWKPATFVICFSVTLISITNAQTISANKPQLELNPGQEYELTLDSETASSGIVQIQLFDSKWSKVVEAWKATESGTQSTKLKVAIPKDTELGEGYFWQAVLYDSDWQKQKEAVVNGVEIKASKSTSPAMKEDSAPEKGATQPSQLPTEIPEPFEPVWTPPGEWEIDWRDEFSGTGIPENWYPLVGYNSEAYAEKTEKGIRWTGDTEETAWMYSSKTGNHWLNGDGQLVMRIVSDKTKQNEMGNKVSAAYLLSGFPEKWDNTEPNNVKWSGKFVSPKETPLYICCRIKTNEIKGYSTWFAFWLFSQSRSYNGTPTDGTEVDIIEITKGKKDYINQSFNVANHWAQGGDSSESFQFNTGSKPTAKSFVDVNDDKYHTFGVEWSTKKMNCYVDGKLYYTFTENIPTDPVDMMMLLTLEFQKDLWDPNQGDGRSDGPFVSDTKELRVMSRVLVDHVRVYKRLEK